MQNLTAAEFASRFRIIRLLGEGSFGQVELAEETLPTTTTPKGDNNQQQQQKTVALKSAHQTDTPDDPNLLNEAAISFLLQSLGEHPHIPAVYQVIRITNAAKFHPKTYLVMQYLEHGETLRDYAAGSTELDECSFWSMVHDAFEILSFLQTHGVLHNDLHAENLLVVTEHPGTVPQIWLLDFGQACVVASGVTKDVDPDIATFGPGTTDLQEDAKTCRTADAEDLFAEALTLVRALMTAAATLVRGAAEGELEETVLQPGFNGSERLFRLHYPRFMTEFVQRATFGIQNPSTSAWLEEAETQLVRCRRRLAVRNRQL